MMETLDSLYPNASIVVVDDHSKDGTADIALEFGKGELGSRSYRGIRATVV